MHPVRDDAVDVYRSPRGGAARLGLLLTVALSLSIGAASFSTSAHAETRTVDQVAQTYGVEDSVATPVARAYAALAKAQMQAAKRWVNKASTSLQIVRVNIRRAHSAAMDLIGKPPTDPESDDPPGPPAVMSVLRLEHRVGTGIVPLFDGRKSSTFVLAMRDTLYVTHATRDKMLDRVSGLAPEGAGADYADDMADTLGGYNTEVNQITVALDQYRLIDSGRVALANALDRVTATRTMVNAAFGGGE